MSAAGQPSTANENQDVMLKILAEVIEQKKLENDTKGTIPYFAKIVQIYQDELNHLKDSKVSCSQSETRDLQITLANARAQLADVYFKTGQPVSGEASLMMSVRVWEKLKGHDSTVVPFLTRAYDILQQVYTVQGKKDLAKHMETRKSKLLAERPA